MKRTRAIVLLFGCALIGATLLYAVFTMNKAGEPSISAEATPVTPWNLVEHYKEEIKLGMAREQVRRTITQATSLCIDNQFWYKGDEKTYARDSYGFRGNTKSNNMGLIVDYVMTGTSFVVITVARTGESLTAVNADLLKCPPPGNSTGATP